MNNLQRIAKWIGIFLNCLLGGVLIGFLVFAPLHQGVWLSLAATVAVTIALLALWLRLEKTSAPGRLLRWGLALAPIVGTLALAGVALVQLYSIGQFAPLREDRLHNFDRFTQAMTRAYPYFDEKEIDWPALVNAYRPRIAAAETNDAYLALIAEMVAALNDCHSTLYPMPAQLRFAQLTEVEGQAIVVSMGETARAAGLTVGDVVVAVNGKPIAEAIAAMPPQWTSGSTPWNRTESALNNLLALYDTQEQIELEVAGGDGGTQVITLTRAAAEARSTPPSTTPPLVWGERLASGVGYIHLGRNFGNRNGQDMVAQFDAALDELMDTPGLILDLRSNGGGSSLVAGYIAGRFIDEPFVYGREYYNLRLPMRFWWTWSDRRVDPRGERYTGALVLLTDATTASSAEEFVVSLVDNQRAATVGRTTAGGTGNPIDFRLTDGAEVSFSSGDLRRVDGSQIEGIGIAPDLPVTWTVADVRNDADPDIAAAEDYILNGR